MSCKAVASGKVKSKGRASLEWYKENKPQYYCYGYIDSRTDDVILECKECRKHIDNAQEDFDEWNRMVKNGREEVV